MSFTFLAGYPNIDYVNYIYMEKEYTEDFLSSFLMILTRVCK